MRTYVVFISEQALATAPRSGLQRNAVMNFIRSLAENPHAVGDFTEKDDAGRILQVKVIGRYALVFWADHAVAEVKVPTSHRRTNRKALAVFVPHPELFG